MVQNRSIKRILNHFIVRESLSGTLLRVFNMLNEAATTCLLFGTLVSSVGFGMIVLHVLNRRNQLVDESLSETDRHFYEQQYRRRMQTSALTVTLGGLIGLYGYIPALERSPVFATCYVIGLLLLSLWLILLAVGDAVASRVYSSRVNRRQRKLRESLHEALMELKNVNDISMPRLDYDQSLDDA